MKEFASESGAVSYAKTFAYSHVEKIATRQWIWDDFPRYKVYENGFTTPQREFRTLADAKAFAAKLPFAQIRDLQQPGWISASYPKYRLYQGDKTLPEWSFAALADAKKTAKAYSNVHIIELSSNQWIWDNLSDEQKRLKRERTPVYAIDANGTAGAPDYAFLLDAMRAAAKVPGSTVRNSATGLDVYSNVPAFRVLQYGRPVHSFYGLAGALALAKTLPGASIESGGREWWTNVPYLTVLQNDKPIRSFHTRKAAVDYAARYAGAAVVTADGRRLWSNADKLLYWGWNGTGRTQSILTQAGAAQGLDADVPTWFELGSADGALNDYSDPELVERMKGTGTKVIPLVHNQFDAKLTSAFLRNPEGQSRFIGSLMERLSELGVDGVNLDFELMAGGDRGRYTAFVRNFTEAAHKRGLTVSIDLPRGDVSWDKFTAYDQRILGGIVDRVVVMAYDQHWSGSDEAGSVSELPWAEQGIKNYIAYGVPRNKLMLGIPFYVRDFTLDAAGKPIASRAIAMSDVPEVIAREQADVVYDPKSKQKKYTYAEDGHTHVFWAETPETVKARIDLIKKYDWAGVAVWKLGYETPDLWTMLLRLK
ncbi:glycosyl hydrolase family 18 protein [Paenibacillus humicola]|uniref:glycosyl hydrolase family 18 protein n=1 Tax=Paenibacillus humicola TaxID=3110540 RepID=UPI00237B4982|nr:glycosyl hydrolase family 18 protein [Paenibacillus humicola]